MQFSEDKLSQFTAQADFIASGLASRSTHEKVWRLYRNTILSRLILFYEGAKEEVNVSGFQIDPRD